MLTTQVANNKAMLHVIILIIYWKILPDLKNNFEWTVECGKIKFGDLSILTYIMC